MSQLDAACADTVKRISAYLDGDLAAGECVAIEAHCGHCPACAELVESLRRTVGLCREAGGVPVPDHVRARARASIRQLLGNGSAPKER